MDEPGATFKCIAVTPETHALFVERADELGMGSDEFVRLLLEVERNHAQDEGRS